MIPRWLETMLESAADRGRELLHLFDEDKSDGSVTELCRALLAGSGEASGIALSSEILRRYRQMTTEQKAGFFTCLHEEFSADPEAIKLATEAYLGSRSENDLLQLTQAVEAPRQELLRRLNMAPNSTAQLVSMRGDLLRQLKRQPQLFSVDADFKHLLSSWFNRGFLQLEHIDWNTPAHILEKLINYETVHAIQGWDDLHRRVVDDRRCFAFTHPAIPDEPLIFVEVALVKDIPSQVQPLLDRNTAVLPIEQADTAVFYSINNTQLGLRGISFGNFLIKQVMEELQNECPWIKHFVTLSPMPKFAHTLRAAMKGEVKALKPATIDKILEEWANDLQQLSGEPSPSLALMKLLETPQAEHAQASRDLLEKAVVPVALAYLTLQLDNHHIADPVAAFHLSNGARLERINPFADDSDEHRASSFGCMVNYLYEPDQLEINHETFVGQGKIAIAKPLMKAQLKYQQLLNLN